MTGRMALLEMGTREAERTIGHVKAVIAEMAGLTNIEGKSWSTLYA